MDSIVSLTAVVSRPSECVMQRIGMHRAYDVDHPALPDRHPLQRHRLHRTDRATWQPPGRP